MEKLQLQIISSVKTNEIYEDRFNIRQFKLAFRLLDLVLARYLCGIATSPKIWMKVQSEIIVEFV